MTQALDLTQETDSQVERARIAIAQEQGRNLYQRLTAVRLELGGSVAKSGTAPAAMGGYRFIQYDDVADKVGELLAKHGVWLVPAVTGTVVEQAGTTRNGNPVYRAQVLMEFQLVNVDEPQDALTVRWSGVGDDGGDKAVQKAVTSATKYFLLKLFLLGGGEDSERNTDRDTVDQPVARVVPYAPTQVPAQAPAARRQGPTAPPRRERFTPERACPQCGKPQELVYWADGKLGISCSDWSNCNFRANAGPADIAATPPGPTDDIPF